MTEPLSKVDWNPTSPLLDDRWRLCWKIGCSEPDKLSTADSLLCGRQFLSRSLTDRHKMLEFRNLLTQGPFPWPVCRMSDYEVFQQISELLKSGWLHLHARLRPRTGAVGWRARSEKDDTANVSGSGTSTAGRPEPVNEPATFSNPDGSAQAAALKAAAANGTPFCAACEAARQSGA
jgi:hypothetical protein